MACCSRQKLPESLGSAGVGVPGLQVLGLCGNYSHLLSPGGQRGWLLPRRVQVSPESPHSWFRGKMGLLHHRGLFLGAGSWEADRLVDFCIWCSRAATASQTATSQAHCLVLPVIFLLFCLLRHLSWHHFSEIRVDNVSTNIILEAASQKCVRSSALASEDCWHAVP